jgi:rhodanese-related sulfurtransferase
VKPDSSVTEAEILDKIMSENNYIIIDVRTKNEYDEEHVVGAIYIAYDEFEENISTYAELYAGKDIIIYSSDGKESELACDALVELGHGAYDLGVYDAITLEKE